ncbi:hypothetical protein [Mycobacterium avium]|uniref:hypothetical protein n=1 Tax=Mycobacterium avium TaxID=1764 RepID=UPI000BAE7804|nr:hypothetical protein [Mycobacterium avium]PBA68872.1 hypothetical protein CKJ76_25985 [Mycobacterium avium]
MVAANRGPAITVGSGVTTARQELTQLAGEHGWEIGEYPAYVEVARTGFIRDNVQVRVEWTEAGSVEHAQRIAKGQQQVLLNRADRDKRATIAAWLTEDVR